MSNSTDNHIIFKVLAKQQIIDFPIKCFFFPTQISVIKPDISTQFNPFRQIADCSVLPILDPFEIFQIKV